MLICIFSYQFRVVISRYEVCINAAEIVEFTAPRRTQGEGLREGGMVTPCSVHEKAKRKSIDKFMIYYNRRKR
jgi:hypothetical protein